LNPRIKARVLEEWRGLPDRPLLKEKDSTPSVQALVQQTLRKLGLQDRIREEEISAAWRDIVGDFLAAHSTPAGLTSGVLMVRVLQPTIHFELERVWKKKVLEKLQVKFGKAAVRSIRFRIG
jgi:predicted nucleic acid-binding Zn ribbon protein